ncbi:hypothetical protein RO3G_01003 [Rhizopus delemar RA 99-880]|uniref:Uncharacterized protein n=1 Tax=Rhizopus delemar (strain RA 99-880 / ATCC MYA-4621 / FGSC 9543 / NRRL 43880) TaxID=246409 RepID=I1BJB9_RHIO9|nr:hypothetical protein RO3G_01003 [Rhizopus delemar RA 99-880]|eukprot:EIE76299.1 hypothetical protein RO3G_01003 [Rhizopus delemar RA 99-880]
MLSYGQLYVAMPRVRKMDDLYFFGAETPLNIKRKFGANIDALDTNKVLSTYSTSLAWLCPCLN